MRSRHGVACLMAWGALIVGDVDVRRARADEVTPNIITVRPSGIDPSASEALTLEERLERRLKRSAEMLRSICVGCGSRDAAPGAAPFSPMDALRGRSASQMLQQQPPADQIVVEVRQVPVPDSPDVVPDPARP